MESVKKSREELCLRIKNFSLCQSADCAAKTIFTMKAQGKPESTKKNVFQNGEWLSDFNFKGDSC